MIDHNPVHMAHCNRDDYIGSCKYGDEDCPALNTRGVMIHAVASLRAAISLLENGGKKAAPSDKMFKQMLLDYHKAADNAAAALKSAK